MKKVLVTARSFGKIAETPFQVLRDAGLEVVMHPRRGPLEKHEMIPLIEDVEGIIVGTDIIDDEVLSHAPLLKVVSKHGVGVDNIDLEAARRRNIVVTNTPGANSVAVAEMALCAMLALSRNVVEGDRRVRSGQWGTITGAELSRKKVGIVGFGAIGRCLSRLLRGFACEIYAYDQYADKEAAGELGVSLVSLDELLDASDYVSLHVPNTQETRNMFSAETFAKMKKTAFLINLARGGVVDELALAQALEAGQIAGAAVDVFSEEPPPLDHPLFQAPNVIVTPHIGAHSREAMNNMSTMAAQNVVAVLTGQGSPHIVR
jgi:D-3-phosphoglycerate dehydrogenase